MSPRLYPIGIQNFEKIRKEGYLYIDKTALIHQMVKTGSYYFLSRPRRFGKSLLISTLEAYFQGKKELFEGLAMASLEQEWLEYPIFHLDLNISKYASVTDLMDILNRNVTAWEGLYGSDSSERSLPLRFAGVIQRAYKQTGRRAVILVDEYDKPLLQTLHDEDLQGEMRSILKPFYGVLKTMDGCIRFALLTGVTKFGKVSVFSDLNNLEDISMDERYVTICGITEAEIKGQLMEDVQKLATNQGLTVEAASQELKERYDGYHFVENTIGIYNPFSLLNTFAKRKFGDYWFETGTPTYLVELLKRTKYNLYNMERGLSNTCCPIIPRSTWWIPLSRSSVSYVRSVRATWTPFSSVSSPSLPTRPMNWPATWNCITRMCCSSFSAWLVCIRKWNTIRTGGGSTWS